MQTRIRERPVPAVAGSLAVFGGVAICHVAMWQLGLEFERAWLRSYEWPLLGETLPEPVTAQGETPQRTKGNRTTQALGERRWVAIHHPRSSPRTRRDASPGDS
jgi:hypothetical protein